MAGNPNWWSMRSSPSQQPSALYFPSPPLLPSQHAVDQSSSLPLNSMADNQEFPQSWSQLLMGGLSGGNDDSCKFGMSHFQARKLENWGDNCIPNPSLRFPVLDVKQEMSQNGGFCGRGEEEFQALRHPANWSAQVMPVSSPNSCGATSRTNANVLDFSNNKPEGSNHQADHSSHHESNSTSSGGLCKKPRVQPSSSQPPLKVRKEKLGDRITALHQMVSPFGKTDTASVLLEAIGYIRFLQGQIEALSSPYLGNTSANMRNQQSGVHEKPKDLRSRGLCLVPISCTLQVGSDNGADYWAPYSGGGF